MNDWRHIPKRPQLPPVFICSIAFWLSSAIVYVSCAGHVSPIFELASVICACTALVFAGLIIITAKSFSPQVQGASPENDAPRRTRFRYLRLIIVLFSVAAAGSSLSLGYAAHVVSLADRFLNEDPNHIQVTLLEDSSDGAFSTRALCSTMIEESRFAHVVVDFGEGGRYTCGQKLIASGKLARCSDSSVDYFWQQGTLLVFKASYVEPLNRTGFMGWLLSLREHAIDEIGADDDAHALIQTLSCGYRNSLSGSRLYASFQTSGLAHVVAVSGAHLVIATALISSLLKTLRVPRRITIALLVLLMTGYTIMAGMPISCMRAALMSSIGILSLFGKRRPSSLNALGITIIGIICSAPHAALSSSFALSTLATMGIVIFGPLVELIVEQAVGFAHEGIRQALSLSLSASFLAQWYASALFKTLPILSPIANIICTPLLPACCTCSLIAAVSSACGFPLAPILVQIAALSADALIAVVTCFAQVPYASIPASIDPISALVFASLCAAFAWITWEKLLERSVFIPCVAFAAALAILSWINPQAEAIYMLDVGQGDSFLITSDGKSMLIDTGNHDARLLEQLARCHIAHLDCVVITHADDDHCGALDALQRAAEVDTIFIANGITDCNDDKCRLLVEQSHQTGRNVTSLNVHDVFNIGKFEAEVLWPKRLSDNGENADSIILKLSYDIDGDGSRDLDALFTGDAESDELEEVMLENNLTDIDILKVGHHGSRNSMTPEQVELLDPKIALIGVGANNRYGHPAAETLAMLESAGCTVLRSDLDGGVKLQVGSGRAIITKL